MNSSRLCKHTHAGAHVVPIITDESLDLDTLALLEVEKGCMKAVTPEQAPVRTIAQFRLGFRKLAQNRGPGLAHGASLSGGRASYAHLTQGEPDHKSNNPYRAMLANTIPSRAPVPDMTESFMVDIWKSDPVDSIHG
jgi:hypothetical protein